MCATVAALRGDGLRVVCDAAVPAIGVGAALACDHVAEVVVVRPPLGLDVAPA